MFRGSYNIDISKTDLLGCSEEVTVYISVKTNLWGVQRRSQYTYLHV